MEKYTLQLIVPQKLAGLGKEIEHLNNYCGRQIFLQITGSCADLKTFGEWAASEPREPPDFILVFDVTEGRLNKEKAQIDLLECLKTIKFSQAFQGSKTIIVLPAVKETELPFLNELIKLDNQNFYFAEEFSLDDIASWIFAKSKTIQDNLQYLTTTFQVPKKENSGAENQGAEKEVIIKEVIREVIKEVPTPIPILTPKNEKEEIVVPASAPVRKRTIINGIFGACHGAGTTSLCMHLAQSYADEGYKVAIVERNVSGHLKRLGKQKGFDLYTDTMLHEVRLTDYELIFIDFGLYAAVDSSGTVIKEKLPDQMVAERKVEMQFCSNLILVASSQPWRRYEAEFYIGNPIFESLTKNWIFYMKDVKQDFLKEYGVKRCILSDVIKLKKIIGEHR